jgi:hypothetical protein
MGKRPPWMHPMPHSLVAPLSIIIMGKPTSIDPACYGIIGIPLFELNAQLQNISENSPQPTQLPAASCALPPPCAFVTVGTKTKSQHRPLDRQAKTRRHRRVRVQWPRRREV